MDNLKEKGIKAFTWTFFGKVGAQGMSFIVSVFLARLLEPADFGLIAMVMVIFGLATVFTDVGLGAALIQRRRVLPIHYSSVFYFNITIGSILTLATYYSASWISRFYEMEELIALIQVMSLLFVVASLSSVQNTLLHKNLEYALLTKIGIFSSLISGLAGITMAYTGYGVWSLVAQLLLNGLVYNIVVWSISTWSPSLTFSLKALTQLWSFGFRIFLSGMLDAIFTRLDFLIIGKLFPPATLGYMQRAKSLNNMVVQFSSSSLMTVLFPILSKVKNDLARYQNIIVRILGVICFVVFMLVGGLYVISGELIVFLFSEKWLPSVELFKILALSGFSYPISALLVNILKSRGNSRIFLRLEIYKKTLMAANFAILYFYGINSYLYGLVGVSILSVLLNIYYASREIKLPFIVFIKPIFVQACLAIISAVITVMLTSHLMLLDFTLIITKGSLK